MNKKLILPVIFVLLVAVVLFYHIVPRSFSQIMKESVDVDPAGVEEIYVLVSPLQMQDGHRPEVSYTLTKEDPTFQELVDLLSSRRYAPLLGSPEFQYITLDCQVFLAFDRDAFLDFSGDKEMRLHSSKHQRYIRTGGTGEAFQREILDLLLDAAPQTKAVS